jgi:hypothetical protein
LPTAATREATATFRFGAIAPLVVHTLGPGERAHILRDLAARLWKTPDGRTIRIHARTLTLPVAHKPETTNSIAPEVGWIGSATGRGRRTVAEGDGREVRAGGGQAEETVVGSGPWQVWRGLATVGRLSTGTKWTKQALGVGVLGKREAGGPRRRHRRARPRAI